MFKFKNNQLQFITLQNELKKQINKKVIFIIEKIITYKSNVVYNATYYQMDVPIKN